MVDRPRNKRALKSAFNNIFDETTGRSCRDYGTDLWVGFRKVREHCREPNRGSRFQGTDFQYTAWNAVIPCSGLGVAKQFRYARRKGKHTAPGRSDLHAACVPLE